MKKYYNQLKKAMALVALFLTVGVNAWGATTVWNGDKPSAWNGYKSDGYWDSPAPTVYFELVSGQGFYIKTDASSTQGLEYNSSYYALLVQYHHHAYMYCTQDRTVCFTMEGSVNDTETVQFVNLSTGEVMDRHINHAKSSTRGAGSTFTVDFKANVYYRFDASGTQIAIKKIEYLVPGVDIIDMDEATDNSTNINTLKNLSSSVKEVRINRTLKANQWNTFCSPVALTATSKPSLDEVLSCSQVYLVGSYDATEKTLSFASSTSLPANTPCLVKPSSKVSNIVFETKDITKPTDASTLEASSNGLKFVGLYGSKNIYSADNNNIFLGSDGVSLYYPSSEAAGTMKGFRAYFELPVGASVKAISFEDDATGIVTVDSDPLQENGNIYTIDGRNMGNAKNLTRGMYIQNGRKFIVK